MSRRAAILDVDGTLVDTNYHHAIAWHRAFCEEGLQLPVWRIHRHIGMGGDQLVAALAGGEVEEEKGDRIRDAEKERYMALIEEVRPLQGARERRAARAARRHRPRLDAGALPHRRQHPLRIEADRPTRGPPARLGSPWEA